MIGTIIAGKYQIIKEIGQGGMGVVYLAKHIKLNKLFALKLLPPQLYNQKGFKERFYKEAKIQAQLTHGNIVQITDFIDEKDHYFIVMEYVEGMTLKDIMARNVKPSVDKALHIIRQIAKALDFAHSKGVIHRDIKPSNVIVTQDGTAKLMDFGIALIAGSDRMTRTGSAVGTPQYMSPEQITRPKDIDARSDLYSLGILLYELLTGKLPFIGDTDYETHQKHIQGIKVAPKLLNPQISEELNSIMLKAIASKRDTRFQSASTFLQALNSADRADTFSPAPDTSSSQAQPVYQKMPTIAAEKTAKDVKTKIIVIVSASIICLIVGIFLLRTKDKKRAAPKATAGPAQVAQKSKHPPIQKNLALLYREDIRGKGAEELLVAAVAARVEKKYQKAIFLTKRALQYAPDYFEAREFMEMLQVEYQIMVMTIKRYKSLQKYSELYQYIKRLLEDEDDNILFLETLYDLEDLFDSFIQKARTAYKADEPLKALRLFGIVHKARGDDFEELKVLSKYAWENHYGGKYMDKGTGILSLEDGYVVLGDTQSHGKGKNDIYLLKTDMNGDVDWGKTYGGSGNEYSSHILQAQKGGYIISGCKEVGPDNFDIWLLRTTSTGDLMWNKTFGGSGNDYGFRCLELDSGKILLLASVYMGAEQDNDIQLILVDEDGSVVWRKSYGDTDFNLAKDMVLIDQDRAVAVAGLSFSPASNLLSFWIKTISLDGEERMHAIYLGGEASKEFSKSDHERYPYITHCVRQNSDNSFFVCGYNGSQDSGSQIYLACLSETGDRLWFKNIGGELDEFALNVLQQERNYLLVGCRYSAGQSANGYILRLDEKGKKLSEKDYGYEKRDIFTALAPAFDKGFVLVGTTDSITKGFEDIWAMKINHRLNLEE